jgi:hypothetical protein
MPRLALFSFPEWTGDGETWKILGRDGHRAGISGTNVPRIGWAVAREKKLALVV